MKRRFSHYAKVVLSVIAVISSSIVSASESSEVSPPQLYDAGSTSLGLRDDRISNLNQAKPDFTLYALSDGTIQFKEKNSTEVLWSLPTGPPLYSSYQDSESKFDYINLGDNGELLLHTKGGRIMHFPANIEQYISSLPHMTDNGVLNGGKTTTVFLVDANSGRLIRTFRPGSNLLSTIQSDNETGALVDSTYGQLVEPSYMERKIVERPLYVTRKDFLLEFSALNSSKILWRMTLAQIGAAFLCSHLDMQMPCNSDVHVHHSYKPSISMETSLEQSNGLVVVSSRTTTSQPNENNFGEPNDLLVTSAKKNLLLSDPMATIHQPPLAIENSKTPNLLDWRMYIFGLIMFPKVYVLALFVLVVVMAVGFAIAASSKRKKNRKSGKNNSSTDKKDGLLSSENEHKFAHGKTETVPFFTLNRLDGDKYGRRVGKLCVSSVEIAKGSNGTVVLEGIFEGRRVAVKRLVLAHHESAIKEIQNLIASDRHPNIVRWYGVEVDQDFVYLSLERCTCSLDDLIQMCSDSSQDGVKLERQALKSVIEYKGRLDSVKGVIQNVNLWKANGYPSPLLLQLMRDVVSGLVHLHELGIIHRDLKPQNVLIIKEKILSAKVSDMGISRRLQADMSSLGHLPTGCGSSGWQAPEQLEQGRQTRAIDLFSLGCVLFFCITGGRHPFGDRYERDVNILKNQVDLFLVESIPEALDLFSHLLNHDPELRPKAQEVLCHPMFWSSDMRLSFLRDTSDRVELEDRETNSNILDALESVFPMALGCKWDEKMEPAFINSIRQHRRYKYDSIRDLLRVIRNKLNHYRELPLEIQELLGPIPEGFNEYFTSRYPKLLIEVYKVVKKYCREEVCFQKYFISA